MKKLFLVFAILAGAALARSQQQRATLTVATSACQSANSCLTIQIPSGIGSIGMSVVGSSGTVQFEVLDPSGNYASLNVNPSNSTTPVSSATVSGTQLFQASVGGYSAFRVRLSASGSAAVTLNPSTASARAGGGGGGGATPSLDQILDPAADKTFAMAAHALGFTYGATTGNANMLTIQDTAGNTGTGNLLRLVNNAVSGNNTLTIIGSASAGPAVSVQNHFIDQTATNITGGPWDGISPGGNAEVFNKLLFNSSSGAMAGGILQDNVLSMAGGSTNLVPLAVAYNAQIDATADVTPITTLNLYDTIHENSLTAAVTDFTNYHVNPITLAIGASIVNQYGLRVDDVTSASNNWAIKTGLGLNEFGDAVKIDPVTVSGLGAATAGQMRVVSDSTTVTLEGQTCVGSSTHTALAFSDGVVWKCF